jgi:HUS1 checkpoint protein
MKFGAKLLDAAGINHFTNIISTLSRLCAKAANDKTCVLKVMPGRIVFILSEFATNSATSTGTGRSSFWFEVEAQSVFEHYVVEGKSTSDEDILLLEIQPESLLRALKSSPNIKSVRMKLIKRDDRPCLSIELDLVSLNSTKQNSRIITHDMPITVLSASCNMSDEFREPKVNKASLGLQLPPLKLLKHMLERMKCLSDFVCMEATSSGTLTLSIEADSVSVNTYFRDLVYLPSTASSSSAVRDVVKTSAVRLSLKRLTDFIAALQFQPSKMICNFVDKKYAHFFVLHDESLVLQYLISSVMS